MPIYEYVCSKCKHNFEVIQKYTDPFLTECPACKQHSLEKLVSAGGFILKGGGWYKPGHSAGRVHDKDKLSSTE